ncbi:MAG: hypothetical protein NTY99_02445 [DPANN group archaeon]|nr:hypothetical protein [DPANN group archaeon]
MADWKNITFYALIVSVIVWFALKSLGIIHSPTLVELYPWFAIASGAGIAYGKFTETLKNIKTELDDLKELNGRLTNLETTCKLTHKRK